MKTKNNVQKAILRSAAVIVSFVLISFTVSAQDFWKRLIENSSFNDIALAMVNTVDEAELTATPVENLEFLFYETEIDADLEIESWMIDDLSFAVQWMNYSENLEQELNVEEWMLDENLFQSNNETESALDVEAWMTSEKVWNI